MVNRWKQFLFWFSASKYGSWFMKRFMEPIDPLIYRLTGGRATSAGPVVIPQLLLTTTGRKSGQPRTVQLAYTEISGNLHLVASNFGGPKHPGWSYNLAANPSAEIQLGARKFPVIAAELNDEDKERAWPQIVANIPNYDIYKTRTDRNIKVYRMDEAG